MAKVGESGVAIGRGDAETLAGRMERALQVVGESEIAEALVIGLGAAALCFLLGYAIVILSNSALGVFAIGIG